MNLSTSVRRSKTFVSVTPPLHGEGMPDSSHGWRTEPPEKKGIERPNVSSMSWYVVAVDQPPLYGHLDRKPRSMILEQAVDDLLDGTYGDHVWQVLPQSPPKRCCTFTRAPDAAQST
ncbi:hypothetical protein DL546_000405 [Coniochaeta pulveracea]|uniref:Uncharacterized protein n=1 Tax=Coniochaeta pulveracea TaxID=177199 RepID=A0A420Y149_9PEZI|nr:hypothetical protein DL546_000405 [Coniochaeta pulveracea]